MVELEYFLVASSVSLDRFTNRLSIFNVVEEIHPQQAFPIRVSLVAVSAWNVEAGEEDEDFQAVFEIIPPESVNAQPQSWRMNFGGQNRRQRLFHTLDGLEISGAGEWELKVSVGNRGARHWITVHPHPE